MITHYDVSNKLLQLVHLLDTTLSMNFQYPNNKDIENSINYIYHCIDRLDFELTDCIDNVNLVLENPKNNILVESR